MADPAAAPSRSHSPVSLGPGKVFWGDPKTGRWELLGHTVCGTCAGTGWVPHCDDRARRARSESWSLDLFLAVGTCRGWVSCPFRCRRQP